MRHEPNYHAIYRKAHPPHFPHSPYERRLELSDLWPSEQENFIRIVDAALAADNKGAEK